MPIFILGSQILRVLQSLVDDFGNTIVWMCLLVMLLEFFETSDHVVDVAVNPIKRIIDGEAAGALKILQERLRIFQSMLWMRDSFFIYHGDTGVTTAISHTGWRRDVWRERRKVRDQAQLFQIVWPATNIFSVSRMQKKTKMREEQSKTCRT